MRERIESLFYACQDGDLERVKQILEDGYHDVNGDNRWATDIDPRGWQRTPLHIAAQAGHLELAKWLCENGADVNRKSKYGDTPLNSICRPPMQPHWVQAVELLMSRGADPTIPNDEGEIPIDHAKKSPVNWEKVKHLFSSLTGD